MFKVGFLFLIFSVFLSVAQAAVLPPMMKCSHDVNQIAEKWGATTWKNRLNNTFLSPTLTLGDWVVVRDLKEVVTVTKENQHRSLIIALNKKTCRREMKVLSKASSQKKLNRVYTDKELKSIISMGKGIFYFISPNMPLSVRGIKPAMEAAKKLNIRFYPVLDPAVKKDKDKYLAKIAIENGLREIFQFDSFEFRMRNVYLHYPTIIGFKNGKMLGKKKYGYEDDYLEDIKFVLK